MARRTSKQVEALLSSPMPHDHRQFRCEAEQAGRILRAQAVRKKQFALILPILSQGMIQPKTEKRNVGKNRKAIREALADLREAGGDGGNAVELQSLIEQACNFNLTNGCFPDFYEEMQAMPVQQAAQLPYAGDDGTTLGQSYPMSIDLEQHRVLLALRFPDSEGNWSRSWREKTIPLSLPDPVTHRLQTGEALAPALREIQEADGTRYAVLDFKVNVPVPAPEAMNRRQSVLGFDWGVRVLATATATAVDLERHQVAVRSFWIWEHLMGGRHAPAARSMCSSKIAKLEARRDSFPSGDARREPSIKKLALLRLELNRCWRKYEARNHKSGNSC